MPTSIEYDLVPYQDCPLVQTRPDNLGVIASLFGLDVAPPDNCRVLELGSASGGNIIPLAYYWPDSQFTGVELSEKQAALGNQIIQELQLSNINIVQNNILTLNESLGTFDYIIAHGVYSWVPEEVREHMFQLIPKILAPTGIAFISYNTFPGWHFRTAVRDIMLYPNRPDATIVQKRDNGIAMLHKLANGLADNNSLSEKWLKKEAQTLLNLPPSYLLHDYLEDENHPEYFYQFMARARANKLQFLSETDMYTMLGSTLTEQAEEQLDEIDELIEYQQQLDFYYVRHFRQTLLCHENLDIDYELDIEKLTGYFFIGLLACNNKIDLNSENSQKFTHPNGEDLDISHPLTKAAMVALSCKYPGSFSFSELLEEARKILRDNQSSYASADSNELLQELFNLFISQGIDVSQTDRVFSVEIGDKPQASKLAAIYQRYGRCCIGNMHHGNIILDELDHCLLSLLDGNKTKNQLEQVVSERIKTDNLLRESMQQQGKNPDSILLSIKSHIEQSLNYFALNGLIETA